MGGCQKLGREAAELGSDTGWKGIGCLGVHELPLARTIAIAILRLGEMGFDPTATIQREYVPLFEDPYLQMAYDGVKVRILCQV